MQSGLPLILLLRMHVESKISLYPASDSINFCFPAQLLAVNRVRLNALSAFWEGSLPQLAAIVNAASSLSFVFERVLLD